MASSFLFNVLLASAAKPVIMLNATASITIDVVLREILLNFNRVNQLERAARQRDSTKSR